MGERIIQIPEGYILALPEWDLLEPADQVVKFLTDTPDAPKPADTTVGILYETNSPRKLIRSVLKDWENGNPVRAKYLSAGGQYRECLVTGVQQLQDSPDCPVSDPERYVVLYIRTPVAQLE
ncbi:hypothetical protein A2Z33_02075 [Candidatus Gottesmanbacteria bacterium RBG_16_52_11]|uniref:Uncharacterized protein n=1 Tax=Candidatus Gottesmanbacteria bacterium RBG_16_52_11 TaxID=1798374 RepID=A0A1F5YRF0_9BACT|nr:MAG: hypothetical protein A2Z33_02075 [Candidatus Gottesmanbacteria bacterium RBG_16_52_11]